MYMSEINNPNLRLRVFHHADIAFGPGKAELLQAIISTGSISKAAKQMNMSYRRAWQLVDTMNRCFNAPLVETQTGGNQGGGAVVTALGIEIIDIFEQMHKAALQAAQPHYDNLTSKLNR